MRIVMLARVVLLAIAAGLAFPSPAFSESLFDGRTLQGWEGDGRYWRVENGAIVGEIPPGTTLAKNTWLIWRGGELEDFDLRLQFQLTGAEAANSGVQFRCQADSVDHVSGYQADLDLGRTWLGRIYDEHGRALLVERGSRVHILPDGERRSETFAPADQYAVLFREDDWNEYRIVAVGARVSVFVNGTLFSQLHDEQLGERDLRGLLALQLHSGPETRIAFRDIQLQRLGPRDQGLVEFSVAAADPAEQAAEGFPPQGPQGEELNLGFERGNLDGWTATGDAFQGQPVKEDGIAQRWPGQTSGKQGRYFIGGYEVVRDGGVGSLTSAPFPVAQRYASFLIGGGDTAATRVEILLVQDDGDQRAVFTAVGNQREAMRRVVADLQAHQGRLIRVRLVDESRGGWGHLNFDDFRFHDQPPVQAEPSQAWRSTHNPLLQHLVANPTAGDAARPGEATVAQMFVPPGFSVQLIAAEPDLHQPMAFTFDGRGRLWVVEGHCYPQKRPAGEGLDRILIFSDEDGDGRFESSKLFADGLNLVSGLEVGYGGVWVGAAPDLLFIPDRDRDDRPDGPAEVLLDGFGFADTHETLNSFLWGPDGWLYGNQGVFNRSQVGPPGAAAEDRVEFQAGVWRYHPLRREFEVFAHGGSNQWGLDYDLFGQFFMTHCRSFWGGGPTTHVVQGGHYWNQVNSGYAPFISATAPAGLPHLKNYLLASARYGHGEGGAGKPGSRAVYGGHSHVGAMVYLGDNWPAEYRNHLFTHNLHGHQLNHQFNRRRAGGFQTLHAGQDMLFCADPQYIGVALKYGPDGAVYLSDWYDPRHCHNPNEESWDRGNGRIYRMQWDAAYQPRTVDFYSASEAELVQALLHPNDWHVRMALQVLRERAAIAKPDSDTIVELQKLAFHPDADRRLRAVWALFGMGQLDRPVLDLLLRDENEFVRGWAVQLSMEALPPEQLGDFLLTAADEERSLFVRRCLCTGLQRAPLDLAWRLAETLNPSGSGGAGRGWTETLADEAVALAESLSPFHWRAEDRQFDLMLWYGMARLMESDWSRCLALTDRSRLPAIRDLGVWYACKLSPAARAEVTERLSTASPDERLRLLRLLELSVRDARGLIAPPAWTGLAPSLYDAEEPAVRELAASIGSAFGDQALYGRMREVLGDPTADLAARRQALRTLAADASPENLPLLLQLLADDAFRRQVLPMLAQFDAPSIGTRLAAGLRQWTAEERDAALQVLASRVAWANTLLDAVASGATDKRHLTAYSVRQMADLGDQDLVARLSREWGEVSSSSEERRAEIQELVRQYDEAPLWAFDAGAGAAHFQKLCLNCHRLDAPSSSLGPSLAGSGAKGASYFAENVIDPNAVIGRDYQASVVVTQDGRVLSGLIQEQSDSAVTLRTATDTVVIARENIEEIRKSSDSFMPQGLLKTLNDREKIELLKYLLSL